MSDINMRMIHAGEDGGGDRGFDIYTILGGLYFNF